MGPGEPFGHIAGFHAPGTTVPLGHLADLTANLPGPVVSTAERERQRERAERQRHAHELRLSWLTDLEQALAGVAAAGRVVRVRAQFACDEHCLFVLERLCGGRPANSWTAAEVGAWFASQMTSGLGQIELVDRELVRHRKWLGGPKTVERTHAARGWLFEDARNERYRERNGDSFRYHTRQAPITVTAAGDIRPPDATDLRASMFRRMVELLGTPPLPPAPFPEWVGQP